MSGPNYWLGFIVGQFLARATDPLFHGTWSLAGLAADLTILAVALAVWWAWFHYRVRIEHR